LKKQKKKRKTNRNTEEKKRSRVVKGRERKDAREKTRPGLRLKKTGKALPLPSIQ